MKFNFAQFKKDIFSSQLVETVSKERLYRAFDFTLKTFADLTDTRSAIKRGQSANELLSVFFEDIGENFKPLQFLMECLIPGEEDSSVVHQLKNYSDKFPKEKEIYMKQPPSEGKFDIFSGPPVLYMAGNYPVGIEIQPQEESSQAED